MATAKTQDQAAQEAEQAAQAAIALAKASDPDAKHTAESVRTLAGAGQAIPSGWAFDGRTGEFFETASVTKAPGKRTVIERK